MVQLVVDADPVAYVLAYLRAHQGLQAVLGAGRVGAANQPPYPALSLTDPPGGDTRNGCLVNTQLLLELFGDPDATQGRGTLRPIMLTACRALLELPHAPRLPGALVVTQVNVT